MSDQPFVPRPVSRLSESLGGYESTWQLDTGVSPQLADHLAMALYELMLVDPPIRDRLQWMRRLGRKDLPLEPGELARSLGGPVPVLEALHDALQIISDRIAGKGWSSTPPATDRVQSMMGIIMRVSRLLDDFGSAYELAHQPFRIAWRVLPEIADAAAATAATVETAYPRAAKRLRSAWEAAFRLHPDPSEAIADAIRAVEAVSIPIVCPRQSEPVFGHVLGELARDETPWRLGIEGQHGDDSVSPVVEMMRRLGRAHLDRHEGLEPPEPSPETAQRSVMLAVALVYLFGSGAVHKLTRTP